MDGRIARIRMIKGNTMLKSRGGRTVLFLFGYSFRVVKIANISSARIIAIRIFTCSEMMEILTPPSIFVVTRAPTTMKKISIVNECFPNPTETNVKITISNKKITNSEAIN